MIMPSTARPVSIGRWLLAIAFMVFLMVVVGGVTRLTESGLSITEWKPVTGAIPPLNEAQWQQAFGAYQKIPQYRAIHADMTLDQFKTIFLWEYFHRLLGRLIGLVFALPLLWFLLKRRIPAGYGGRLTVLFLLGAAQGAIGWWMVASGLVGRTEVSQYRLAVHLLMALAIMGLAIWSALDLFALARTGSDRKARLTGPAGFYLALIAIQILFGALTAGLRAGAVSNTWPLMNGHFFPEGVEWLTPVWRTFGHDPFLVHFVHRWWAWVAFAAAIGLARMARRAGVRPASIALHTAIGVQILLGIATVLENVALPLAALHQAVGAIVVASAVWCAYAAGSAPLIARASPLRP